MFGSEFIEQSVLNVSTKGVTIIPFVTAGYPEKNQFSNLVMSLSGTADVIETEVPFSDGVTIQRSNHQAIESGVRLQLFRHE
jgi:tryptophan synthase alpha subunit